MKGYLTTVEAKLLQPVNETFYLVPTYGANCGYLDRLISGASRTQYKPVKRTNRRRWADCLSDD